MRIYVETRFIQYVISDDIVMCQKYQRRLFMGMQYVNQKSLLSVIVPVYNTEIYLERCIDSIISQTYKNLEIILVDDGSTDRSGIICDEYKQKDERIRVVHQKNAGPSAARNCGLDIARGKYIGFVDSDDYIAADMYENLQRCMKAGIDITCCGTISIRKSKSIVCCKMNRQRIFNTEEAIFELLKGDFISFAVWDKLFRKSVIGNSRFPQKRLCEDLPFTYQVIKKSKKVIHIGNTEYFYCYRENSRSKSDFSLKRLDYIFFTRDIYRDVNRMFPQLSKIAEYRYFINMDYLICQIENSRNKKDYVKEIARLKHVLRHMRLRIILNPFMSREQKWACLKTAK